MSRPLQQLTKGARVYLIGVILAGAGVGVALAVSHGWPGVDQWWVWVTFAVFTSLAATVQMFNVTVKEHQGCCITLAFVFAAVLLLDYPLLVLSMVIVFTPEWVKNRRRFYVQAFNIANFILGGAAARGLYLLILDEAALDWRLPLAMAGAIVAFTLANHGMLAGALHLARKMGLRESGLFQPDSLLIDTGLAGLGASLAVLWMANPWLLIIGAYPLLLMYRALEIPNLRQAAITDPKTGIYNYSHFCKVAHEELKRAARRGRPLAILMGDLDLLRNVNNTYGHIAGDEVLKQITNIIVRQIRTCDVAARFGGEEFVILLPDTKALEAAAVAERIRERIALHLFEVSTNARPVRASMSVGVAAYPEHGLDLPELIHQADLAVRWAKLNGRNRACVADPSIAELLERLSVDDVNEWDNRLPALNTQLIPIATADPTKEPGPTTRHLEQVRPG